MAEDVKITHLQKKLVSILDIDLTKEDTRNVQNQVNSPRTKEACLRLGIDLKELNPINRAKVEAQLKERERKPSVPKELIDMRVEHLDKKRHEKYRMIKEERETVIHEIEHGVAPHFASVSAGNSTGSGGNLFLTFAGLKQTSGMVGS